ncbi:MAG: DUF1330 domain-containing protein [Pseudomonadota bacterium]
MAPLVVNAQAADPGDASTISEAPPTYVNSTPEAYAAMQALPMDQPLQMLNLIRFNDDAAYAEGSEFASKGWSGEQAYAEYSRLSAPFATGVGGKPIYIGVPQLMLIGPQHETWDAAFIIEYPSFAAFLSFVNDPEYQKNAFHRSAAVADSRLIRLAPPPE